METIVLKDEGMHMVELYYERNNLSISPLGKGNLSAIRIRSKLIQRKDG